MFTPPTLEATVEIELVALHLHSIEPIFVPPDSFFDVVITRNPDEPSPGHMTISHDTFEVGGEYGEFDISLNVQLDFLPPANGGAFKPIKPLLLWDPGPYAWQHEPLFEPPLLQSGPNFFPVGPMPDVRLDYQWGTKTGGHPVRPVLLCPLPPQPDTYCWSFQTTECQIDNLIDEECWPLRVSNQSGTPEVMQCTCFPEGDCGPVQIDGTDVSCAGGCPNAGDICYVTIDGISLGVTTKDASQPPYGVITCECDQPQDVLCPLPTQTMGDPCFNLQNPDCLIASVTDEECWPHEVQVDAASGGLFVSDCACFPPDDCGPVTIVQNTISCDGTCETASEFCQVILNGTATGETSIETTDLTGGDHVTCDCRPPLMGCCWPDGVCTPEPVGQCGDPGIVQTVPCDGTTVACCLQDGQGTCVDADPVCCDDLGGVAHAAGSNCQGRNIACCLQGGGCITAVEECCPDENGTPSLLGVPACLGDFLPHPGGNTVDDACEIEACCLPDGNCVNTDHSDCVAQGGDPQGRGSRCADLICQLLKWAHPPVLNPDSPAPECFWGWDEPSVVGPGGWVIVADDWPCDSDEPVTDIHWWGSYLEWTALDPPPVPPTSFHIGIWTDVPAGAAPSHPDQMVWEQRVLRTELNERAVGCDWHTNWPIRDTCFKYDYVIPESEWFRQDDLACSVYWVSIAAIYEQTPTTYVWGWKTRRYEYMDWPMLIQVPNPPNLWDEFGQGILLDDEMDMAFVLTTQEELQACCKSDVGIDPYCENRLPSECIAESGTPQGSGTACTGDAACCLDATDACVPVDPVCCDEAGGMAFPSEQCSSEAACCLPNDTCEMLDPVCCEEDKGGTPYPGESCTAPVACCFTDGSCEDLDPVCCLDQSGDPQAGGSTCQTTNCQPSLACCLPSELCVMTTHDNCVARGGDPHPPDPTVDCSNTTCNALKWAQPPTYHPESQIPACFWGWDEVSIYDSPQFPILADDWLCMDDRKITDIHWWGSYLNTMELPAVLPSRFHIGIWTDRPVEPQITPFSHPDRIIKQWIVPRAELNETSAGCDFFTHPNGVTFGPEACYRYDFQIPPGDEFQQDPSELGHNVYWLSISAIYDQAPEIPYPWGWKTRHPTWNDDAVRILDPTAPNVDDGTLYTAGIPVKDSGGNSWDMAFVLTTDQPGAYKWEQPPNPARPAYHAHDWENTYTTYANDWLCEGGVVTDLHWWGTTEDPGEGIESFHLSIHDDIPAADSPFGYSMPGPLRWVADVPIGNITISPTGLVNSGLEPIFLYEYYLPDADHFHQEEGRIYWLDIRTNSVNPSNPTQWKWQESSHGWPYRFDSAVWDTESIPWRLQDGDMAFRVTSTPPVDPPIPPPSPYDFRKNRYIAFDANNPTTPVAIRVQWLERTCSISGKDCSYDKDCWTCAVDGKACHADEDCTSGVCVTIETCDTDATHDIGWVGEVCEIVPTTQVPVGTYNGLVVPDMPALQLFPPVTFVTDCEIQPRRSYALSATADGAVFSAPLILGTILEPYKNAKYWADVVGQRDPGTGLYTEPNQRINVDDVQVMIVFSNGKPYRPHVTVVDLSHEVTDYKFNADDLQMVMRAFNITEDYPPLKFIVEASGAMVPTACPGDLPGAKHPKCP